MEIIFGLVSFILVIMALAGFIFCATYLARKVGIMKKTEEKEGVGQEFLTLQCIQFKRIKNTLIFRFSLIIVLVGLSNIPLGMVEDIVMERSRLYQNVLVNIANTWGHQQNLQGPVLLIPYTEKFITTKVLTDKEGNERKINKTSYQHKTAIVLPDVLNVDVDLVGKTRKRGLYESLVYSSDLKIAGYFKRPDMSKLSHNIDEIHWDRSWLSLGLSDTQAINKVSPLKWNISETEGQFIDFEPSTRITSTIAKGFHAPLKLAEEATEARYSFALDMNVNGSDGFYFSPIGKTTHVSLKSDWPHPSFQGDILPSQYNINAKGFSAEWSVPHLARNYPQIWTLETDTFDIGNFSAGVDLFESVSLYSKITRAIKYGSLFFILTYITFLIFEMGIGKRLHIVQYGMIGLALSMFYLTLLSVAEQAGFYFAYILAAGITISLISLYAYAVIQSLGRTGIISALLSGLYFILYSLLKLEDHALMGGTVLLLVILAVMMYMTRNIGKNEVKVA